MQRSCLYYYMDALHGRKLNGWKKKLEGNDTRMLRAILNKPQMSGNLTPITKTIKDEPEMQDTAGEVGTSS